MKAIIFLLAVLFCSQSCRFSPKVEQVPITQDTIILFRSQTAAPLMHYAALPEGGSKILVDSLYENDRYVSKEFILTGLYSIIDSITSRQGLEACLRNVVEQKDRSIYVTEPLIYALLLKQPHQSKSFCLIQWCKPLAGDYTLRVKKHYRLSDTNFVIHIEAEFATGYKKEYRYQITGFYPDNENPYL